MVRYRVVQDIAHGEQARRQTVIVGITRARRSAPHTRAFVADVCHFHNSIVGKLVLNGQVVIRPMMYVALSYDHRIVDGREAVQFLVRLKELVEEPGFMLVEG